MKNYTLNEFSKVKNIGKTTLYKEINAGRLKAFKIGKKTLIPESSAEEWQSNLIAYPVKKIQEAN